MSSLRVIATCFAIGEAAGTAGALSAQHKKDPGELDVGEIQQRRRDNGVPL